MLVLIGGGRHITLAVIETDPEPKSISALSNINTV